MYTSDTSYIVLLVKNANTIFSYFNVSSFSVKEFEDKYGFNMWNNSKPALKVYYINNGNPTEVKTIIIDSLANNWYINLNEDDKAVFVKLGRLLPDDRFIPLCISNTVITPRKHISEDKSVYYVDLSDSLEELEKFPAELPIIDSADTENKDRKKEPKPYPFLEKKIR
jgi:hypothetical protein